MLIGFSLFTLAAALFVDQADQGAEQFGAAPTVTAKDMKILQRMPATLGQVYVYAKPRVFEQLQRIDSEVESIIRSTVRGAPKKIWDLAIETAIDTSSALDSLGVKHQLTALRNKTQTSNIGEIKAGFEMLSQILAEDPGVKAVTEKAIDLLEIKGILGRGVLSDALVVLATVAAGGDIRKTWKSGGKLTIPVRGGEISLSKAMDYNASMRIRNPLWTKSAVRIAIEGSKEDPVRAYSASYTVPTFRKSSLTAGVAGTAFHPAQQISLAAPTTLGLGGRHGRAATVSPTLAVDPRKHGERKVGISFKVPLG